MTTTRRSRQSSIASRAPASLRIPSLTRRASNTQISLVFAQGDASRPNGVNTCETALSRQLDGDLGGKQMGLRSRRSSNATVRTTRTVSGFGSPSPSISHTSVLEEDEDLPLAGPSTSTLTSSPTSFDNPHDPLPLSDDNHQSDEGSNQSTTPMAKRLNPKASSTWLKWTSPTPTFPRSPAAKEKSKGKGKGKERQVEETDVDNPVEANIPQTVNNTTVSEQPSPAQNQPQSTIPDDPPDPPSDPPIVENICSSESLQPPAVAPVNSTPAPSPAKSRGWWGRQPAQPNKDSPANPPPRPPSPAPSVIVLPLPSNDVTPEVVAPLPPRDIPSTVEASPAKQPVIKPARVTDSYTVRGWKGYLGWREEVGPSTSSQNVSIPNDPIAETVDPPEPVPANAEEIASPPHEPPHSETPAVTQEDCKTFAAASGVASKAQPSSGWSTFLYSIVVPQIRPADNATTTTYIAESAAPKDEPEPEPGPQPDFQPADSAPALEPPTVAPASQSAPPPSGTSRRPSAAGWLNYLAFRASQKTIAVGAGANSIMTAETGGRNSSEVGSEEVMDFSSDPEFPSAQGGLIPSTASGKGKEVKIAADSLKSVTPTASQNLTIRKKRLSNASTKSGGSLTPVSSSPKARSSLDIPRDTSVPVKPGVGSSLPPPPQAPSTQPNLVLPTFNTTFDRPPRSLLPVQAPEQPSAVGKGITAATTGLAWKALGAVGSYVYGDAAPKPGPESILEDPKETRGKAEGGFVGADLPRRIGLGSGTPDDGWKNVKRVVVVGVHGWFPAKMLNSVIGEPTGTSVKFANMMGQAVKQFFDDKGVNDIRLTLMPLEGEGTIENRIAKLYKAYLSNPAWINDLRRADAIFFAAHSQGCIVTTHLISRLIAQGHIRSALNADAVARCEYAFGPIGILPPEEPRRGRRNPSLHVGGAEGGQQKVAMLAMCGVHLGPFQSISTSTVIQPYLQWFENTAARELFEFQETTSAVSLDYQEKLSMILENSVRVVLVASLNDQVVPIYGASFSTATHPLLLRALYVDGASYSQSDFMTNLLCFAFMLRNAGIDDQRLVEHLSEATAGSLTGIGHSTPYEEISCYNLAVSYLFHAGPALSNPLPKLEVEHFSSKDPKNDFELPWIMRALVDSPEVKDLFPVELKELRDGIGAWRPSTKALKEIKKRLEPMAGRQQSRLRPMTNLNSTSTSSLNSNTNNDNQNNGNHNVFGTSPGVNKALPAGKVVLPKSRL